MGVSAGETIHTRLLSESSHSQKVQRQVALCRSKKLVPSSEGPALVDWRHADRPGGPEGCEVSETRFWISLIADCGKGSDRWKRSAGKFWLLSLELPLVLYDLYPEALD